MGVCRCGLSCVLELLLKEADEEVVVSLWRLFLMYDELILGNAKAHFKAFMLKGGNSPSSSLCAH